VNLRLAVIGAGHLGKIHARLAQQHAGVSLVAVVDPDENARAAIGDELQVPTFAHHCSVIEGVDAAIIATPTTLHHDVSRELLAHDIHLLIEKPITATAAQARELVDLAAQRQLTLQVGHVERFNPALTAARPYLKDAAYIEAVRTSGYACRSTDIGVILDLMIHDLDIAMWLADGSVHDVQAVGTTIIGPHEDMVQARLTFSSGCVANLTASRTSYAAQRTMRIFCRQHCLELDFAQKSAQLIAPSMRLLQGISVDNLSPVEKEHLRTRLFEDYLPITPLAIEDRNAILDEQQEFVANVRTGRRPRISGFDAHRVLQVAEQIRASARSFEERIYRPRLYRRAG
jgi:predicted dehydrogenase